MSEMLAAPAAERNKEAIYAVLRNLLPKKGLVLEVAAGNGAHSSYFAERFPALAWLPSDCDPAALASIEAYRREFKGSNLREPINLDVTAAEWPVGFADVIVCINLIHIAPWEATAGLAKGAGKVLRSGGRVYLYGPFMRDGRHTAPSNENFDLWLKERDQRYGVRDLTAVSRVFAAERLMLEDVIEMPANNLSLWLRKS